MLSLTASGFRDGLGERILTFDRAHGQVLERLRLRPELAAFEAPLGRRFEQLARLDDPRLVRLQALERDEDGRLALLSTYTGGVRASEAIRAAREREIVPDLALGLYVAAETLAALHALHAEGCPHGALALERVALTPEGAVLVADYLFAEALGALRFSPHRLWREFRLVVHNGDSPFTPAADIRQTAFVALAFITGRPLDAGDHESIEAAVSEATEAALIRGGRRLAHPLATWFRRAITGGSPRGFADAAAAAAACD
ncbi:MAG TPA: hypothetical protein VNK92_05450, partial [Vicinamibacterales bacterium]|nr:hypothetical protein [Vicinamibacterales bacterium]